MAYPPSAMINTLKLSASSANFQTSDRFFLLYPKNPWFKNEKRLRFVITPNSQRWHQCKHPIQAVLYGNK